MYSLSQISLGCCLRSSLVSVSSSCSIIFAVTPVARRAHMHACSGAIGQDLTPFNKVGLLRQREPDVGSLAADACKGVRRDTDHSSRFFVQMNRSPYDRRITSERPHPQTITQHGDWRRIGLVLLYRVEEPA